MANRRPRLRRALSLLLISCLTASPLAGCSAKASNQIDTVGGVPQKGDWSHVITLARDSTIKVALKGGHPVSRNFVAADDAELIVLNLSDPALPRDVTDTLRSLASEQPAELSGASHGRTLTAGRVRLGPDGVFLDGRKVAALDQVVEQVARNNVAEISRVHRAVKRGFGWGALIGVALGLAVTLAACGTDWSQETSSCSNLTPLWVVVAPLNGTLIGGALGAAATISTVVYRAQL